MVLDDHSSLSQVTSCLTFLLGVRREKFPCFEHCWRRDRKRPQINSAQQARVSALAPSLPFYLLLHWVFEAEVKRVDSIGLFS